MSDRSKFATGLTAILFSVLILILPLAIILFPAAASLAGYYTIGLSMDRAGLDVIILTSIIGGAACVAGIWLIVSSKNR